MIPVAEAAQRSRSGKLLWTTISLYGRPEVMEWCDENGVDFIFGLPGNAVLDSAVDEIADDIRTRRALDQKPCLRGFAETNYRAKSWKTDRRACARVGATTKGLDIVTSIETGSAEHIYETLYCARATCDNGVARVRRQGPIIRVIEGLPSPRRRWRRGAGYHGLAFTSRWRPGAGNHRLAASTPTASSTMVGTWFVTMHQEHA
jgi:hypothetical protein